MHEQQTNGNVPMVPEPEPSKNELAEAWREVGAQFQQLGTRLASALRRSWEASGSESASTETMRNLRDDLREAANRVDHVIQDVSAETADERSATLRATRRASEQSLEEARMLTAATLKKLNKQLDHLVRRLEEDERKE
jgi:chromosome segregation ATPase